MKRISKSMVDFGSRLTLLYWISQVYGEVSPNHGDWYAYLLGGIGLVILYAFGEEE